jgi:hypothetical protein
MKNILTLFFFVIVIMSAQNNKEQSKSQIVEASCGQCQFGMEGHGCELAVRIDGKPYFVDGTLSIPMGMPMPMMAFVLLSESPLLAK